MTDGSDPRSTQDCLLQAARECFGRVGIAATSVDMVCREAGLSRTTFYRNFDGIDQVLAEISIDLARESVAGAIERARGAPSYADKLVDFMTCMLSDVLKPHWIQVPASGNEITRAVSAVLASSGALRRITPDLDTFLADGRACGELRANLDTARAAGWLLRNVWSLLTIPSEWSPSPEEQRKYLAEFVVPALLATSVPTGEPLKALKRLDEIQVSLARVEGLLVSRPAEAGRRTVASRPRKR